MIGGLDLEYWNKPDRWYMGWRPDNFFDLPVKTRKKIEKKVKKKGKGYAYGKELTDQAIQSLQRKTQ